jgi:hypothetical protein
VSHYKPPYVLYLLLAGDFDSTAGTAQTTLHKHRRIDSICEIKMKPQNKGSDSSFFFLFITYIENDTNT